MNAMVHQLQHFRINTPRFALTLVLAALLLSIAPARAANASASSVSTSLTLPMSEVRVGQQITIPLHLTLEQGAVYSVDLRIGYDPTLVTAVHVEAGEIVNGWSMAANLNTPGIIQIGLATGNQPLTAGGDLIRISFRASQQTGHTALTFLHGDLNEGGIGTEMYPGGVTIRGFDEPLSPRVTIAVTGNDIELTWGDDSFNAAYEVHRDVRPYFTPRDATRLVTLAAGGSHYVDTGAAGGVAENHFYVVRAVGTNEETADSNRVGEIDYAINNEGGKYTLIATPFLSNTITDAASLAEYIGDVGSLLAWNPISQAFRFFAPPNIGDNFVIQPGSVVFVSIQVGGPDIVTLTGDVVTIQYDLQPDGFNFISLPLQRDDLTDAASVAVDMSGVISMLSWNAPVQAFRFFAPPDIGDNFAIGPGSPFIVNLGPDAAPVWPDNALDAVDSTTMPSVHRLQ